MTWNPVINQTNIIHPKCTINNRFLSGTTFHIATLLFQNFKNVVQRYAFLASSYEARTEGK